MRDLNKTQWLTLYRSYRIDKTPSLRAMHPLHYLMAHRVFKNNPANYYEPVSDLKLRLTINEFKLWKVWNC